MIQALMRGIVTLWDANILPTTGVNLWQGIAPPGEPYPVCVLTSVAARRQYSMAVTPGGTIGKLANPTMQFSLYCNESQYADGSAANVMKLVEALFNQGHAPTHSLDNTWWLGSLMLNSHDSWYDDGEKVWRLTQDYSMWLQKV